MKLFLEGGPGWLFLLARLIEMGLLVFMTVIWCMSMERALRACDHSSRRMSLGQSYLIFIPFFGFVWQFIAVNRVSTTLASEYHFRGWKSDEGRPAIEAGLTTCVVILVVFLLRVLIIDLNPGLAFFTTLGICICMYMHRERLNAFTERIEQDNRKIMQSVSLENTVNPFLYGNTTAFNPQWTAHNQWPGNQQQAFPQQGMPWQQTSNYGTQEGYVRQQYAQRSAQQYTQQQAQPKKEEAPRAGWDGTTTWAPPQGWEQPDLSDPSPYFN
jgi:hypothetical protein